MIHRLEINLLNGNVSHLDLGVCFYDDPTRLGRLNCRHDNLHVHLRLKVCCRSKAGPVCRLGGQLSFSSICSFGAGHLHSSIGSSIEEHRRNIITCWKRNDFNRWAEICHQSVCVIHTQTYICLQAAAESCLRWTDGLWTRKALKLQIDRFVDVGCRVLSVASGVNCNDCLHVISLW